MKAGQAAVLRTSRRSWFADIALAINQLIKHGRALRVLTEYNLVRSVSGQHMGFLWWFAEPLINALIFYFVVVIIFHRGGPDYHFTLVTGLLCWQLFANTVNSVTSALTSNSTFLLRGIFPPLVAVVAPVFSGLFLAVCAFSLVMFFSPHGLGLSLLFLPVVLIVQVLVGLAVGLPLAILNVALPDTRRLVHFITRFGWFMSPILYPVTRVLDQPKIPDWFKAVYMTNPMVHTLNGLRFSLTGETPISLLGFGLVAVVAIVAALIGMAMIIRHQNFYMKRI